MKKRNSLYEDGREVDVSQESCLGLSGLTGLLTEVRRAPEAGEERP